MATVTGSTATAAPAQGIVTMPAVSSFIAAFEYDATQLTLTTHLKSGAIYQHKFVTPLEFSLLQTSQNHSKHWSDNIKGKKVPVKAKVIRSPTAEIKHKGRK